MSIGQTLDRLTCSAGRKEGRSIKGNFDWAAVAWSSSQSSLIIAFFPPNSPQSGWMSGDAGGKSS